MTIEKGPFHASWAKPAHLVAQKSVNKISSENGVIAEFSSARLGGKFCDFIRCVRKVW